ncbi:MAG: hypothetical protein ACI4KR_07285 [Ruminiclostridium sp.]
MAEKEYIEREIVRAEIKSLCDKYNVAYGGHYGGYGEDLAKTIDNLPAADVASARHGRWLNPTKPFPCYDWKCSECGCEEYRHVDSHGHYREMNYCPNCGAKMDRSDNG